MKSLLALTLATSACAGEPDAAPDPDGAEAPSPSAGNPAAPLGDPDDAASDPALPDVTKLEAPDLHVTRPPDAVLGGNPDGLSCLTFYTDEEGSGSDFERELTPFASVPRTVFLNRRGGVYSPGTNDSSRNISSIPTTTVQVAPYEGSEADWRYVVSCVQSEFSRFNVRITDQDPGAAAHIEAVVGDGPQAVGLPQGIAGVSPFNCGVIERSIVYVFSAVVYDLRQECEFIAHEVGHSLGLEHEYLCPDPMTYLGGCGQKTFQDQYAYCGTSNPVNCSCGTATQNTVQKLYANVGPAQPEPPPPPPNDAPPQVSIVSPANGATLPGNSTIQVTVQASDDVGISDVRLLWEFQGTRTVSCSTAAAPFACTVNGNLYTFQIQVGTGARAFSAEAVDTSNQVTRSARYQITLSSAPPADAPPTVTITTPANGTVLAPGTNFSVRAFARDDHAVRQVSINWQTPTSSLVLPLNDLGNGTWGIELALQSNAVSGYRIITATATDDAGQLGTSAPVTLDVP